MHNWYFPDFPKAFDIVDYTILYHYGVRNASVPVNVIFSFYTFTTTIQFVDNTSFPVVYIYNCGAEY